MSAAIRRAFNGTQYKRHAIAMSGLAEGVEVSGFDLYGLIEVMGVDLLLHGVVEAGTVGEVEPERISRQQSFAERQELTALFAGLVHVLQHLGHGGFSLEPNRCQLHKTDGQLIGRLMMWMIYLDVKC